MSRLKDIPSWLVLLLVLFVLLGLYQIRPDATSEDSVKAVLGALLLSLRSVQPSPPPPVEPTNQNQP